MGAGQGFFFFFCGEFSTLGDKMFQIFGKKFLCKFDYLCFEFENFHHTLETTELNLKIKIPGTGSHHPAEREAGPTQLEGNLQQLSSIFKSITPHSAPQGLMIDPTLNTPKKKVLGGNGK